MELQSTTITNTPDAALENGIVHVQSQLSNIIKLLSAHDYTNAPCAKSSIGAHARHIIEFMQAVETATTNANTINYDARKRNINIETSQETALVSLNNAAQNLRQALSAHGADHPIFMIEQLSNNDISSPIASSLGRETAYVIQHAIHHIYIIKTIAEKNGITLDENIGIAPATITHQNKQ